MEAAPGNPKFSYTFFLNQDKKTDEAVPVLEKIIAKYPAELNSVFFLGNIYLQKGDKNKTTALYNNALKFAGNDSQKVTSLQQALLQIENM